MVSLLTSVVDCAVSIRISTFENLDQLCAILTISNTSLQLLKRDIAIVIRVKGLEDSLKFGDIVGVRLDSDGHQSHLLHLLSFSKLLHVAEFQLTKSCSLLGTILSIMMAHPGVLEGL